MAKKKVRESKVEKIPFNQIKEDIETIGKGKYPVEEDAVIGENRGQLFVRIPSVVSTKLKLKKGQKIYFKISYDNGKPQVELEIGK